MNKCAGVFGWLFGHRFESLEIEYVLPSLAGVKLHTDSFNLVDALGAMATRRSIVRCRRCGVKADA